MDKERFLESFAAVLDTPHFVRLLELSGGLKKWVVTNSESYDHH